MKTNTATSAARSKEYRIFEEDKYGNLWFEMSYSGIPEIQKENAERYVNAKTAANPETKYQIKEVS